MICFTPINDQAFNELIEMLPRRHRLGGRSLLVEVLFRARRNQGWYAGIELERGQFAYGEEKLGAKCYLSYQETRTLIKWFEKVGFLTIHSTNLGSVGTIIEYNTYVKDRMEINGQTNGQLTDNQRTANDIPKDKGTKVKRKRTYTSENLTEAHQALQCWKDHAGLPKSANEEKCLKALDDLHRIDGVPWDGATGIYAICGYAAREWVPNSFIAAPTALRDWTKAKDQKKYEAIQQQISTRSSHAATNGIAQPPEYRIAYSTGDPVTGFTKRIRRIVDSGLDTDPDQGHEWSIPDDEIAHAKAEGIDTFLKQRQQTSGADHAA